MGIWTQFSLANIRLMLPLSRLKGCHCSRLCSFPAVAGPDITYFLDSVFHSDNSDGGSLRSFGAPRVPGLMGTQEQ